MMQNLKRNWLASSKLAWGILRILTRASKISKICTLMNCFWPKYIMLELFNGTEDWYNTWRNLDFCRNLANFHRLKNRDFILESKMAKLNEGKKIQNKQFAQMQCENFILPWKKMNSTIYKTFCTCSTESLFLRYRKISKKAVKLGSFL